MTQPVIDLDVFNEISELMGDSLDEFIETYLENSPKLLNEISTALITADLDTIFLNAHQLKGGSGSIGAMQVFEIAKQLENDARQGKADNLMVIFVSLQSAFAPVVTELKTHLQ